MIDHALLDTNIAIYLATEHRFLDLYRPDLEGKVLAVSFVTAAELLMTSRKSSDPTRTLNYWRERLPHYVVLFPDLEACDIWATMCSRCRSLGRPRQDNDLWVAAIAVRHNVPLVTHNRKHFEDIEGLTLITHG